jgi:hypothetical protein
MKKLPGIVECGGAVVRPFGELNPAALLMLKLRTAAVDEVLLPLSERVTPLRGRGPINRTRDLLFVEGGRQHGNASAANLSTKTCQQKKHIRSTKPTKFSAKKSSGVFKPECACRAPEVVPRKDLGHSGPGAQRAFRSAFLTSRGARPAELSVERGVAS